jgi:hypothetical protein
MSTATLYRIPPRVDKQGSISQKFPSLLQKAGLPEVVKRGDTVAVKMHFGEPGNIRYLRPIFAVMLVEELLKLGAKPFVTDTAVLYRSPRHNAWDYYRVARRHGYTPEVLGCPLIISGGITDRSVQVSVPNAMRLKEVGVTTEIHDADALISLAHVTLHLQYPIGATVKNLGMGCVDIATKTAMHDARGTKPRQLAQFQATLDGTKAVLSRFQGKFFALNLMLDVTPDCDCWNKSELPVVPDLGILAGRDAMAIDRAAFDLITAAPGYPGSKLDGSAGMTPGSDKVQSVYPKIRTQDYFDIAEKAGIGSSVYRIEEI